MPARTSSATTSLRAVPLVSTTSCPSLSGSTRTPSSPSSTARAAAGSLTSNRTLGDSPTISATGPDATIRPLLTTTAWVQVCSTSASRWLETSTARPSVA